jgi:hypothetical protein
MRRAAWMPSSGWAGGIRMSVSTASGRVSATARSSQGRSATAATMPGWLQPFVEANPISVTSDALRALLTGGPARTPVLWSLA